MSWELYSWDLIGLKTPSNLVVFHWSSLNIQGWQGKLSTDCTFCLDNTTHQTCQKLFLCNQNPVWTHRWQSSHVALWAVSNKTETSNWHLNRSLLLGSTQHVEGHNHCTYPLQSIEVILQEAIRIFRSADTELNNTFLQDLLDVMLFDVSFYFFETVLFIDTGCHFRSKSWCGWRQKSPWQWVGQGKIVPSVFAVFTAFCNLNTSEVRS